MMATFTQPFTLSGVTANTPDAPTNLVVNYVDAGRILIAWNEATTGHPIDAGGYQVLYRISGRGLPFTNGPFIPVITPGVGSFTTPLGTLCRVTAGGQASFNGVVDRSTSNVTKMAYDGFNVQLLINGVWYAKAVQ